MPELSSSTYSETDGSNNQPAPNGMPEGMPPSGVNDSWRAGMGAVKRSYDRDHAGTWVTVGGSGNAVTLTYAVAPASYVQGEKYAFKATAANTGAATVNINSLGAKNIYARTPTGPAALIGGEIQIGDIVEIAFDGTEFVMIGMASNMAAIPSGAVMPYAGSIAPNGWLICYGQAVSRATYAALFTVIGTVFGGGDGSTTFNLPDFRGRVAAGADNMGGTAANRLGSGSTGGITGSATVGISGGEQSHTLSFNEMPVHSHGVNDPTHAHNMYINNLSGSGGAAQVNQSAGAGVTPTTNAVTGISIQNAGGGAGHNVVQPTLVLNYIIKT